MLTYYIYYTYFYNFVNSNLFKCVYNNIKNIEVKSIIKRKSLDFKNRRALYVVYEQDSLPLVVNWEEKIQVGDSIIKPKGSLKLIIKNNFKIDTLDYEEND